MILLMNIATSNLYLDGVSFLGNNSIFEKWELSNFDKIIFSLSLVIAVIAIVIYLLKLVVVTIRLFRGFWASLEDED